MLDEAAGVAVVAVADDSSAGGSLAVEFEVAVVSETDFVLNFVGCEKKQSWR